MEQVTIDPFYTNWTFWAVFISALALILTQLPPVRHWFKPAKIDLETYLRINVTHKVGNPNLQLFIIISNIGGRSVKILGSEIDLYRDNKLITTLIGRGYLQDPADQGLILLTRFSLKPNEEWDHIVQYYSDLNRQEEKSFRDAENALKINILNQEIPDNPREFVEAENTLVEPFKTFFEDRFIFEPGEYEMVIKIKTDNPLANLENKYRFILFESDTSSLKSYTDDYKYGDGIYWHSKKHTGIIVPITKL